MKYATGGSLRAAAPSLRDRLFASDLRFSPVWQPIRVDPRILELLEQPEVVVHLPPPTAPEATL